VKLYEYQAKRLFKEKGIPIPEGKLASSNQEVFAAAQVLGKEVIIKSQILAGGRGKAGGILLAKDPEEAKRVYSQILGKKIKGLVTKRVLVEEDVKYTEELYLGLTVDRSQRRNILVFTRKGGVDIEEVASQNAGAILKYPVSHCGDVNFVLDSLKEKVNFDNETFGCLQDIIKKLCELYFQFDCQLAEINPLVLTCDRRLVALDAKIVIDDNALFRQQKVVSWKEELEADDIEREAHRRKIAYVRLSGDVGIIGNGAGLVMATMDEVQYAGKNPANFLDIGGGAKREFVRDAIEIILMDPQIKGVFVNIFGGITRCDEVAMGIISAFSREEHPFDKNIDLKSRNKFSSETHNKLAESQGCVNFPVVIRLQGTRREEAKSLLANTLIRPSRNLQFVPSFIYVESMKEGAEKIAELVKESQNI
jgi:succinyl-CoA synthetase beta subunit